MEWTPYALPYLAAAAVSALAAGLIWRHYMPAARTMRLLCATGVFWSLGKAAEVLAVTLDGKEFWLSLQYPAFAALPVLWFVFSMQYSDRGDWISRRRLLLLAVIPVITLVLEATNSSHHLVWHSMRLDASGPVTVITQTYGPWFYVLQVYSYVLIIAGAVVLMLFAIRSPRVHRVQSVSILVAALLPASADITFMLGRSPVPQMDLAPAAFAPAFLIIVVGVLRYHMFGSMPAARSLVVDTVSDAVLVLDAQLRIVDLNPAAAALLRLPADRALGLSAVEVAAAEPGLGPHLAAPAEGRSEAVLGPADRPLYFDVVSSALGEHEQVSGWVVMLRDVSARKRAEQERDAVIADLQQAVAGVRTLSGLIPICPSCKKVRHDDGYWEQVEGYVRDRSDADFSHGICPACITKLYPEMADD